MKTFSSLLALLILAATCFAERPRGLFTEAENALDVLLRAKTFSGEAVGVAGIMPETVKAFRLLCKDSQADAVFKHLAVKGSASGQLYALCGLYFTDYPYFQKAAESLRRSTASVETEFGCLGGRLPVSSIIESTSQDAMRLKGPDDSYERWQDAHAKQQNVVFDMVGGGYPNAIRGRR